LTTHGERLLKNAENVGVLGRGEWIAGDEGKCEGMRETPGESGAHFQSQLLYSFSLLCN
jgi:hypothetical protein